MSEQAFQVTVIFDRNFGERLRKLQGPVWITMSDINAPVVRELWTEAPGLDHLKGITGFTVSPNADQVSRLLEQLDNIDLHHGLHSTSSPYNTLRVFGLEFTDAVHRALVEFGFVNFSQNLHEFTASRIVSAGISTQ